MEKGKRGMNGLIGVTVEMVVVTCCYEKCGITWAVPKDWQQRRRDDHHDFYCPNGHVQGYYGKSEKEKRIAELERTEKVLRSHVEHLAQDVDLERNARQSVQNRLRATRGVVTKIRNRVAAGVCPCCNRTFKQLARHMKDQHPDYAKQDTP